METKSKDTIDTLVATEFVSSTVLKQSSRKLDESAKKLSKILKEKQDDEDEDSNEDSNIATLDDGISEDLKIEFDQTNGNELQLEEKTLTRTSVDAFDMNDMTIYNNNVNKNVSSSYTMQDAFNSDHNQKDLKSLQLNSMMIATTTKQSYEFTENNYSANDNPVSEFYSSDLGSDLSSGLESDFELDNNATKIDRIKTWVNDKTFQFTEDQGNFSKSVTVASKTGETAGKAGTSIVRASKRLDKAMDDKGTGQTFIEGEANKVKRKGAMKAGTIAKTKTLSIIRKVVFLTKVFFMKIFTLLIAFCGGLMTFMIAPITILVVIVCILSLFGGGDSAVTEKYEDYMVSIQENYDQQVDDWLIDNPEGIVIAIKGNYGNIDWKSPLTIIQGTIGAVDFDNSEQHILEMFRTNGLFERHEEIISRFEIIDEEGEEKTIEVKTLSVTNASFDDYLVWCQNNFSEIQLLKRSNQLTVKDGQTDFTSEEIEQVNLLRSSDILFSGFSNEFQEHSTQTGDTPSEDDLDSTEYTLFNPLYLSGYRGQCTWYAYGRALKVTNKQMPTSNAQFWIQNAYAMGLPTGLIPSKNAVIVLSGGFFGHVAFVESWDGTKITVSEGNYNNPCSNGQCDAVEYANLNYKSLVHEQTYESLQEYKLACQEMGLQVIGFIYTD